MPSGIYIHKPHSKETRKKISDNHPNISGKNHPFFGKHHSKESNRKRSEALKNKPRTEETRKKISSSNKGEKNHAWKGGLTWYYHKRARELFGTPMCQECNIPSEEYAKTRKKDKKFDMHCVSKDYTILEGWNWKCLCHKCHKKIHREEI